MEKGFNRIFRLISYMLTVLLIILVFAVPVSAQSGIKVDFFSAGEIASNIKNLELNMTSIIYVKDNGGNWVEYQRLHGDENRIWTSMDKMPENLKNAFIAIEDETFRTHKGVNWKRTLGAIGNYIFKYDDTQFGGSTITQQLIKNITLDKGKNAYRKIREIVRAIIIEAKLSKDEILEAYLNTIALGNGINGVQVAANNYFNKDVSELTLAECACIAAITQNPSKYNPLTSMENNKVRRNVVLDKMLELGLINEEEYAAAYNTEVIIDTSREENLDADIKSYFVDALIEEIIADLAEKNNCSEELASSMLYNGGYKIYSTLNLDVQQAMEKVYLNVNKYFYLKGKNLQGERAHVQSAMTIMDYEGHIVGLVGGAGEKTVNRGLNRAISSPRQPGSTMKPIGVYALAIEKDLVHYTSKVLDQPIENYYEKGKDGPKEWYGFYKDEITLDYAIRKSANTIPVRLLKEVGIENSYSFLTQKLGCKFLNDIDKNLSSLALGGCDLGITTTESAAAYAIFGNNGVHYDPTTYYKIEDFNGNLVLKYEDTGEQVISPATATIMNHLLQGVVYGSEGTGSGISGYSRMKAYAKTGTSSESNDLWMVAGTPYYVGSVWYGFDMPQQVNSTSAAATIWRDVMREVHKDLETKEFVDSAGVYKKGSGYYKVGTRPDNLTSMSGIEEEKEEEIPENTEPQPPVSEVPAEETVPPSSGTVEAPPTTSPPNEDEGSDVDRDDADDTDDNSADGEDTPPPSSSGGDNQAPETPSNPEPTPEPVNPANQNQR